MKNKEILFGDEAQKRVFAGLKKTANAVKSTLGPKGKNVLIQTNGSYQFTKDGISVAKSVELSDNFENLGAQIAKEAGNRSVKEAGDGTTSTITLLDAIVSGGARHTSLGVDAMGIRRGIEHASKKVVEFVKKEAVPVNGIDDLRRVATISANGDEEIGNIIADTLHQAGADATVTLEEGRGVKKTRVELTKGFEFDRGMLSELFMNDVPKQRTVFNEPVVDGVLAQIDPRFGDASDGRSAYVWVVNGRLGSMADESYMKGFMGVINLAHSTNVPLVIIAETVESDSLQTLLSAAHNQKYPVIAIKAPGFGADRRDLMFDMAAFTGATVRRPESDEGLFDNFSLAEFGTVKSITVGIEKTVMIAPDAQAEAIEVRVEEIDAKLAVTTEGDYAHTLTRRKSMLTGGVANIIIGGHSEAEIRERRDLFEDALLAARAAAQGGIVPGAGTVLVRAAKMLEKVKTGNHAQDVGIHILKEALLVPFQEIINNGAAVSAEVALEKIQGHRNPHYGYDSNKEEYCDLIKRGIVDPARVIISEVEHASSMAGLLLSTNVVIGFEQGTDMEKAMGGLLRGGR